MEMVRDREIFSNPYLIQMDRFADSLEHLTERFLYMERYKRAFTEDEVEEMSRRVFDRVCEGCGRREWCLEENRGYIRQMVFEILCAAEDYGAELNMELKKKLRRRCEMAPEFLGETLDAFGEAKRKLLWSNRIVQNREGCALSMVSFADTLRQAVRELGAGIFTDERLKKRIVSRMKKVGIRVIHTVFYMRENGKYEMHLTLRAKRGQCVATKEVAKIAGQCAGRVMYPEAGEQPVIWEEYSTVILREGAAYHTLQGVAKIGKGCGQISGDTFLMTALPGGRVGVVLSDGMGTGEKAFRESAKVVEMLEELLKAGFPVKTAVRLLNTVLVMAREEVCFSTVDLCVFDLYEGSCEILKAGASTTFIRSGDHVERISSLTLPVGVVQDMEIESIRRRLPDGSFVALVTDGVMDALPVGEQEALIGTYMLACESQNPKEIAHYILERVLEHAGEAPLDDMTVLVVGLWKI